jgi:hypothetical protein
MSMLWKWYGIWCNCNSSVVLLTTSTHRESLNYVCVRDREGAGIANGDIRMWFSVVSMHFLPLSFPCVFVKVSVTVTTLFHNQLQHATHLDLAFHPLCFFIAKLFLKISSPIVILQSFIFSKLFFPFIFCTIYLYNFREY